MKTINVNLDERSYPIYIGDSILSNKKLLSQYTTSNQVLIVTNLIAMFLFYPMENHIKH